MIVPVSSIKDSLKSLFQLLHYQTIIPSSIFIIIVTHIILPELFPGVKLNDPNTYDYEIILIIFFVTLCYLLYAYNFTMIRILEGYVLRAYLKNKESKYREYLQYLKKQPKTADNIMELYSDFPDTESMVLPTRLGNIIASFENYSYNRYGMDAVVLWPRIIPILEKEKFITHISREKALFDFLLNLFYLFFISGFFYILILSWKLHFLKFFIVVLITIPILLFIYYGLLSAAKAWGETVRVSFDLYRNDLWRALRVSEKIVPAHEKQTWVAISDFFKEANRYDVYQSENISPISEYLKKNTSQGDEK